MDHKDLEKLNWPGEYREIKLNKVENIIFYGSVALLLLFYVLLLGLSDKNLKDFIELFVQVNITGALAIAALVASIGTFRWDHYIKGLKAAGMEHREKRKEYIKENAKNPLYLTLFLISLSVLFSLITLMASSLLNTNEVHFLWMQPDISSWIRGTCLGLVFIDLGLSAYLIKLSLGYMKELLYR